jgi:hypothetical protein
MHINLLCACWHLEAMKGSSSLTSCRLPILSRLSSSLIRLNWRSLFPPWGSGPPLFKMATPFTGSAHTPLPGSGTHTTLGKTLSKDKDRTRDCYRKWDHKQNCEPKTYFLHERKVFCDLQCSRISSKVWNNPISISTIFGNFLTWTVPARQLSKPSLFLGGKNLLYCFFLYYLLQLVQIIINLNLLDA